MNIYVFFFKADNRRKVRNMLSQAPDYSAFLRGATVPNTSTISAQMKVEVFQFLSTSRLMFQRNKPNEFSVLCFRCGTIY